MISSKKYVDQTLKKYNLEANKALGQNFLIEEKIVDNIINNADISKETYVIEIGPGLGALTEKLISVAKYVHAFEIDKNMCNILSETFCDSPNFSFTNIDFLKLDLDGLFNDLSNEKDIKIISNLPYYITSQILNKILFGNYNVSALVVMMQKEVGIKLIKPTNKELSPLYSLLSYKYKTEVIQHVGKNSYLPRPDIDSIVLKISKIDPIYKVNNENIFYQLLKDLYKNRRKTITNNLQHYFNTKEQVINFLKSISIDENKRIEQLTLKEITDISNRLG